jgi:ferrous iron transport protein B
MAYSILSVGNPNSGKTTLFNELTGSKQRVGNWAGVTVEKKTGQFSSHNSQFSITDLPGIYSLDSGNDVNSIDEAIAAKAVLNLDADLIVNIVDATSLERSLYMTLQLRELGRPMVVVLNKIDVVEARGQVLDVNGLSDQLGVPVYALSAHKTAQVSELKQLLAEHCESIRNQTTPSLTLDYPTAFENAITRLTPLFEGNKATPRSLAIRALESDQLVLADVNEAVKAEVDKEQAELNLDIDLLVANVKFTKINQVCKQVSREQGHLSRSMSERIDSVLLNKFVGVPLFFVVMYLMFMFSINIGGAFIDFFDITFGAVFVDTTHHVLDGVLPQWLVALLADGVGAGIQTVATFIPVIAALYLFLSLLESSGYMSRAAFVLDKVMQKIGLPGKAFVPLVLGFGCNVPSIMATRTLDQERERKLAASMAPFMSCGARLPVYALFAAAFFPESGQNLVFALYLLGIVAAVFTGLVLKHTLYPGSSDSLIMEMPDYELPTMKNVVIKTWQKLKRFVLGAGKTIVVVVTILSFLNSIGTDGTFGNQDTENSVLSKVAQTVTPVFEPMGIQQDNWAATVGIITGIFAKEAVVGTLNSLYSPETGEDEGEFSLASSLQEAVMSIPENLTGISFSDPLGLDVGEVADLDAAADEQGVDASTFGNLKALFATNAAAISYLIFILLYTPCVAAMGAYAREFGQSFARFIAVWTFGLAYFGATLYNQVALLPQQPMVSMAWIVGIGLVCAVVFALLKRQAGKQPVLEVQVG